MALVVSVLASDGCMSESLARWVCSMALLQTTTCCYEFGSVNSSSSYSIV